MEQSTQNRALPSAARKTFTVPVWILAFLQTFTIWQMGVIYYSSKVFTVNGVTPLPVSVDTAALPIAAGYLAGAALAYFLPRRVGLWARLLTVLSLVSILLMFAPLPETALAALYYFSVFTCVAFISVAAVLAINIYSLKTALKDGIIATLISAPFIALLHYQTFALDFRAFNILSAVIQVLILIGLTRISTRFEIPFIPSQRKAAPGERAQAPVLLVAGTIFVFAVICLCVLFSSTTAESVENGISLFYISSAVWAALFAWLHFRKKINPFVLYTVFLGIAALGFILWLLPLSAIKPISIVLQGADSCLCNLAWFIAAVLFEQWNKRMIAPGCVLIALVTVLLHSGLLEALRNDAHLLYAIYAGIALVLLVVYFLTEPYFRRVWIDVYKRTSEETKRPCLEAAPKDIAPPQTEETEPDPRKLLTTREAEVLTLAIRGYDNATIAKVLCISANTVKFHMKNIFQKMGVHNRFELTTKINRLDEK